MRRLTLLLAACSLYLTAQRVRAVPDDTRTVTLAGNRYPLARAAFDVGAASPRHRMDKMILVLDSSDEQNQALDELIAAQQNPASAGYQKWLTPDEFADQLAYRRTMWTRFRRGSHRTDSRLTKFLEDGGPSCSAGRRG